MKTALEEFYEYGGDEEVNPVERLRFFCSLSMPAQDWLDVEQFFLDIEDFITVLKYGQNRSLSK
jgi:hypothetical protein